MGSILFKTDKGVYSIIIDEKNIFKSSDAGNAKPKRNFNLITSVVTPYLNLSLFCPIKEINSNRLLGGEDFDICLLEDPPKTSYANKVYPSTAYAYIYFLIL